MEGRESQGQIRLQCRGRLDASSRRHDPHRRREERAELRALRPVDEHVGRRPARRSSTCTRRRRTDACSTVRAAATIRRVRSARRSSVPTAPSSTPDRDRTERLRRRTHRNLRLERQQHVDEADRTSPTATTPAITSPCSSRAETSSSSASAEPLRIQRHDAHAAHGVDESGSPLLLPTGQVLLLEQLRRSLHADGLAEGGVGADDQELPERASARARRTRSPERSSTGCAQAVRSATNIRTRRTIRSCGSRCNAGQQGLLRADARSQHDGRRHRQEVRLDQLRRSRQHRVGREQRFRSSPTASRRSRST